MFERFTDAARGAVVSAAAVAADLDSPVIGTEHVLVALAADAGVAGQALRDAGIDPDTLRAELADRRGSDDGVPGVDRAALSALGIDYDEVRRAAEDAFGPGALDAAGRRCRWDRRRGRSGHRPFTANAKRSLERALREALALRDRHIGSEHLLLGLLGPSPAGPPRGGAPAATAAARLLAGRGVDLARLRDAVLTRRHPRAG
jgi:ATP-dependent Clp protease ATP-binding subunit ClpA